MPRRVLFLRKCTREASGGVTNHLLRAGARAGIGRCARAGGLNNFGDDDVWASCWFSLGEKSGKFWASNEYFRFRGDDDEDTALDRCIVCFGAGWS